MKNFKIFNVEYLKKKIINFANYSQGTNDAVHQIPRSILNEIVSVKMLFRKFCAR